MMKNSFISICLLVTACYAAPAHANVLLNVSLTNFTQSTIEVSFDIEATFSSLDSNGDPQSGDFVSSLLFGLENSSASLLSSGLHPYDRFTVDTAGYPWDGAVDDDNGRISLDARTLPDYLVDNTPLILARLYISTVGLANDNYVLSLNSPINFGQGTLDGVPNDVLDKISVNDGTFTVLSNHTVPEPSSLTILMLGAVAMLNCRRRSV